MALLFSGCVSSNRYVIIDPSKEPLRNYSVLDEVKDFSNNLADPDALLLAKEFPSMIVDRMNEYNAKHPDARKRGCRKQNLECAAERELFMRPE